VAVIVVVGITAGQALTDASEDEVANEMDCVSMRPPPPSCQLRAVSTTTTDPSATTSSTIPPPTTTTTTPPPPTDMTWTGVASTSGSTWRADATITLSSGGSPVAGATVTIRVTITEPQIPVTYEISCTTDGSGTCVASFVVPDNLGVTIDEVQFEVIDVDSPQPVVTPPGDLIFPRP
jgi:hypothetical protein